MSNPKQINLRVLRTMGTINVAHYPDQYGSPVHPVKSLLSEKLQWQTIEDTPMGVMETDWQDVDIVTWDQDTDTFS